ncbi:hypothetical protein [Commensalibacter nepenthis]|uniref:Uncharacterized protein n=1 Tax=Commensalibacter nepenthis TaxID=3043872 RepID=A0ABT6Q5L1_9PROT|nr:hypothetical protein [Commensalibacter sp. TBRC 10068]MDI2112167.1 hypothetical protein [Commensalibacter sp. TBRC 10068]
MAKALDQCFKKAGIRSPIVDQCLVGSGSMLKLLIKDNKISQEEAEQIVADFQKSPIDLITDKTIPMTGTAVYSNYKSLLRMMVLSALSPRYTNFEKGEMLRYIQPGVQETYKNLVEKCK